MSSKPDIDAQPAIVVQPKMVVGAVDDPAEREADRVAAATVRRLAIADAQSDPMLAVINENSPRITRAPAATIDTSGGFTPDPSVEQRIVRASGAGRPLEPDVRRQFEGAMGADLSNVRIHRSAEAAELNTELQAKAFTAGNDVFFSTGSYAPTTSEGRHLLAHELAHTVQQGPRVRRSVIRRLSLHGTDFSKTTSVEVFKGGGSGRVAKFSDGGSPLIVKTDQLIGNEVATAGNLHAAVAGQAGGVGGFSILSPKTRLATPAEEAAIAAAAQRLVKPGEERNFLTGLSSDNPTVIMEPAGGKDFVDVISEGNHVKKGFFGGKSLDKNSIVYQIANTPGPLTTLAQQVPVDVVMGMNDRLIGYYNSENFRYDASTKQFGFVDNTQNGPSGFITTVKMLTGPEHTNKDAFDSWCGNHHVKNLGSDIAKLAKAMFDTSFGPDSGLIDDLDPNSETGKLYAAAVRKNQAKMLSWISNGITTGLNTLKQVLANPLPLVSGVQDGKKLEAVQSLIARRKVLEGVAPKKAWDDAATEAQKLLPPRVVKNTTPWTPATPSRANASGAAPNGNGSGSGSGSGSGWKSAQPQGRWKSAQPQGRWKSATPSRGG